MEEYLWTNHARENMRKRIEIKESWVMDCIKYPDLSEYVQDPTGDKIYHYKKIVEFESRVLKVVTTADTNPIRIITIHFHRGLKGKI